MRAFVLLLAAATMGPALAAAPASAQVAAGPVKAGVDAWLQGNYDAAIKAWRGPAEQGDADAQFNLAQAYKMGRGVSQDMTRAQEYYRRAALQGHLQASDNYGLLLFQNGQRKEALPWIVSSADRGEPRAQYILGIATFNGDNVAQDPVRAYALMTRSAGSGLPQAVQALAAMDKSIPLEQRQLGVSLAGELEARIAENRSRQLASADLGVPAPLRSAPVAAPVTTTPVPPSSSRAGADFANPVEVPPAPNRRVVGSYISGVPSGAVAATPAPAPVARPARQAAAAAPAGRYRIQLGAFGQKSNSDALWGRLAGNRALAGRGRFDVAAGGVTRLQAGPFANEADARAACTALGVQCVVVRP